MSRGSLTLEEGGRGLVSTHSKASSEGVAFLTVVIVETHNAENIDSLTNLSMQDALIKWMFPFSIIIRAMII